MKLMYFSFTSTPVSKDSHAKRFFSQLSADDSLPISPFVLTSVALSPPTEDLATMSPSREGVAKNGSGGLATTPLKPLGGSETTPLSPVQRELLMQADEPPLSPSSTLQQSRIKVGTHLLLF